MQDVIKKEQEFNHPIDRVWKAISTQEEISTWFIDADFKAEVGYGYTFTSSPENNCTKITGEVKSATPYTLVYTWKVEGTSTETTVKWMLEETESGTKLYLEHSGISNYPDEETAINFFNSFNGGWDNCVSELSKYVNEKIDA